MRHNITLILGIGKVPKALADKLMRAKIAFLEVAFIKIIN
jgi:hypothetical protein